jgi:hypothetical protein
MPLLRLTACSALLLLAACGGSSSAPAANPAVAASTPDSSAAASAWTPHVTDTWQWQLSGTVNTSYTVRAYDVDLFNTPQSTIDTLHTQGKAVICYFSAGSAENWRPDYGRYAAADLGNPMPGWAGERWVDTRSTNVRAILADRLALAQSKHCDGVEPDNVDAYANSSGFALTAATQLDFNRFLATQAHALGLQVGLKNDVAQIADLVTSFDFAVNEQCHEFAECADYAAFTGSDKPVFNAEYADVYRNNTDGARNALCATAHAENMRTLVLPLALDDSSRFSCEN